MAQIQINKNYFRPNENVKSFDNIAEAKAAFYLRLDDTVITKGYTTANDGGGADYRVVAGGTGTDDGGSYLDMSNGNQLELVVNGRINIKTFGAIGDDSTDNRAKIQNAVDFKTEIHIPEGTFLISDPGIRCPDNLDILGEGKNNSILKKVAGVSELDPILRERASGSTELPVDNFRIEGVGLIGNGDPANKSAKGAGLIRFYASTSTTIKDCSFQKSKSYGLGLQGAKSAPDADRRGPHLDLYLENCDFFDNGLQDYLNVTDSDDGVDFKDSDRAVIIGCRAWNNGDKGFDLRARQLSVSDCYSYSNVSSGFAAQVEGVQAGVTSIEPASAIFVGCHAKDNSGSGFTVVPQVTPGVVNGEQYVTFESCEAINNVHNFNVTSQGTNDLAIVRLSINNAMSRDPGAGFRHFLGSGPCEALNITGGVFKGGTSSGISVNASQTGPTTITGIHIEDIAIHAITGSADPTARMNVSGCTFKDIGALAVSADSNNTISGNTYINVSDSDLTDFTGTENRVLDRAVGNRDIASSGTVTLKENAAFFNITGTTNITTISGSWKGREVSLRFLDVLTVTDGSNLRLAGNFVTSSNDILNLIYDGTAWYEISRSTN